MDEAHRLAGAAGFVDQGKTYTTDCACPSAGDQSGADDSKRFATLRARLALAGFTVQAVDGTAGCLVSRWGMSSELPDILAVHAFANQAVVRNGHP